MTKKQNRLRARRAALLVITAIVSITITYFSEDSWQQTSSLPIDKAVAISNLDSLEVKGRAPKTGYERSQFGNGWSTHTDGCDTRNKILKRDLSDTTQNDKCQILTGNLNDPYTGMQINFSRTESSKIFIAKVPTVVLSLAKHFTKSTTKRGD